MGPLRPNRPSDHVASYLARGESVVMEMKQHWARLLPAICSCLLGLVLVLVAGSTAPAWMGPLTNAAWWIWLVLLLHLLWRIVEWRDETFVITNKRLVLVHGLFVKKVAMMPLTKVTDMSYNRSPAARLLGYGTFKIESAGQEQALDVIDFVRDPDEKYRDICGLIFGFDDEDDPHAQDDRAHHDDRRAHDESWHLYDDGDRWPEAWDDWRNDGSEHSADAGTRRLVRRDGQWAEDDSPVAPLARPRRRPARRAVQDADETDPYGIITGHVPNPDDEPPHPYPGLHDARDGREAWRADEAGSVDGSSEESAWSVSREHATRPQAVRASRHSATPTTWRDQH